jgi:hypothetical protein
LEVKKMRSVTKFLKKVPPNSKFTEVSDTSCSFVNSRQWIANNVYDVELLNLNVVSGVQGYKPNYAIFLYFKKETKIKTYIDIYEIEPRKVSTFLRYLKLPIRTLFQANAEKKILDAVKQRINEFYVLNGYDGYYILRWR